MRRWFHEQPMSENVQQLQRDTLNEAAERLDAMGYKGVAFDLRQMAEEV
jgi:hypothetical protein